MAVVTSVTTNNEQPEPEVVVTKGCQCVLCMDIEKTYETKEKEELINTFSLATHSFDFKFPKIESKTEGGSKLMDVKSLAALIEDVGKGLQMGPAKAAEVLRFVAYGDIDVVSNFPIGQCIEILNLLQTEVFYTILDSLNDADVAADFLRRVLTWFVYSWHAFLNGFPQAGPAARHLRWYVCDIMRNDAVAGMALATFKNGTYWPVIGPTQILEMICGRWLFCLDTLSLLSNLTRVTGFASYLNELSLCIDEIKGRFFECSQKILKDHDFGGPLITLMINLIPLEEFAKFMVESNSGYFIKTVLLQLISIRPDTAINDILDYSLWFFLRNLCMVPAGRNAIMSNIDSYLGHILYPIAGPEEISPEDMGNLPLEVQFLEPTKSRTWCIHTRECIIDTLFSLCRFRKDRIVLRDMDAYQILKHYHLAETDARLLEKLEDLINVLIRTEDEIGLDDLMEGLKLKKDGEGSQDKDKKKEDKKQEKNEKNKKQEKNEEDKKQDKNDEKDVDQSKEIPPDQPSQSEATQ